MTQQFPSAGVTNFAINTYDILENLVSSRDELGQATSFVYDPLNRLKTETLADGATVNLGYNAMNSLTNRVMPAGTKLVGVVRCGKPPRKRTLGCDRAHEPAVLLPVFYQFGQHWPAEIHDRHQTRRYKYV